MRPYTHVYRSRVTRLSLPFCTFLSTKVGIIKNGRRNICSLVSFVEVLLFICVFMPIICLSPDTITINDVALKVVEKFCYLGSNVTASGSLVSGLDARIGKAASTFGKLRSLSGLAKPAPLDSCQDSCLCYLRAQHAALRLWNQANIPIPGEKAQRVPFSLPTIHPGRHLARPYTKYCATIMERTGAPDIFSLLRIYRLRWSGHVSEWKMVGFRRISCMGNYPLLHDLSVAPNSATRTF